MIFSVLLVMGIVQSHLAAPESTANLTVLLDVLSRHTHVEKGATVKLVEDIGPPFLCIFRSE